MTAWYGDKITCICAKSSTDPSIQLANGDDIALIEAFLLWISETTKDTPHTLVTYNGKDFDIPFILARLAMETDLSRESGLFILDYPHIDLFEEIKKLTGKRMGLSTVAKLLGCTPKSGDGIGAIQLAKDHKYEELKEYCMQDVLTTQEVYLKLKELSGGTICKATENANMPGMIY